jgi:hypothetical protein
LKLLPLKTRFLSVLRKFETKWTSSHALRNYASSTSLVYSRYSGALNEKTLVMLFAKIQACVFNNFVCKPSVPIHHSAKILGVA